MKNEIKIIITLSIIIFILIGFIIFWGIVQGRKNRAYQDNIRKLETTTTELRNANKQLRTNLQTIEKERDRAIEIIAENGKIISRLENENNSFRANTKGFDEDLTELEELLTKFFAD